MKKVNNTDTTLQSEVSATATPPLGGRGAIVDYKAEHAYHFERLNKAWIEKYFWLEETDKWVLENPHAAIISTGGAILMATYDGAVAGTVALKKVSDEVYEFTKMAVDETYRRRGVAEALSYAALEKAKELGAQKVILYSQTSLAPAIHLYRKLGFVEIPMEKDSVYKRSDIKMEISLPAPSEGGTPKHSPCQSKKLCRFKRLEVSKVFNLNNLTFKLSEYGNNQNRKRHYGKRG